MRRESEREGEEMRWRGWDGMSELPREEVGILEGRCVKIEESEEERMKRNDRKYTWRFIIQTILR